MRPALRILLWIFPLLLAACGTDYSVLPDKVQPPVDRKEPEKTPQTYRIKRIVYEGMWAIGATTELDYGPNGKVSQARYVGHDFGKGAPKGVFAYNTGNLLTSYDYQYPAADNQGYTGEQTRFSYVSQDNGPTLPKSTILFAQTDFVKADGTRKLLKYTTSDIINELVNTVRYEAVNVGTTARIDRYTFSAGNLMTIASLGPNQTEAYIFDDKPNPFRGLFGPDITPVRRHSRNNVTGVTITYPQGNVQTYTISYIYDEQGLPIIAQPSGTSSRIRFEYETY